MLTPESTLVAKVVLRGCSEDVLLSVLQLWGSVLMHLQTPLKDTWEQGWDSPWLVWSWRCCMPQNVVISYHFTALQPSLSRCCPPGTWSRYADRWSGGTVCNEIQYRGNFRAEPSREALAKFIISCLVVSPLTALHPALRYILCRKYAFKSIYMSWIRLLSFLFRLVQ